MFARTCTSCHTLTGHDIPAPRWGDLAIAKLSRAAITSFASVMPIHLTRKQVDAVAAYVSAVASGKDQPLNNLPQR
jgi:mono/diheme cytochrome c family protein